MHIKKKNPFYHYIYQSIEPFVYLEDYVEAFFVENRINKAYSLVVKKT